MNVLVIGSGGREHALAWKAAQSATVKQVFVAPGNAGTALEAKLENVPINPDDIDQLLGFAQSNAIDLTIVGPEVPLVNGLVDAFNQQGLKCFGPVAKAAQLEGSKAFAKDFLKRHNIPTAAYQSFEAIEKAKAYVQTVGTPIVIKADGLAAGKGVIVAEDEQQAFAAIEDMLAGNRFGQAGHRVVIEEFLRGEEASFICMVDGETVLPLASSQDHKARDDGDTGPNTGGMGAYSPAPVVDGAMHQRIMQQIIMPTVQGLKRDGIHYRGFLYAGVMIDTNDQPKVLEFNCRFGDPETQPIMMRLKSDLVELCLAAIDGDLAMKKIDWDHRAALGVVMAAGGYPDQYQQGLPIQGAESEHDDVKIFHAGTKRENDQLVTAGGRVLCVTALAENITKAQQKAYHAVAKVNWPDVYYRRDIGHRAIKRELT